MKLIACAAAVLLFAAVPAMAQEGPAVAEPSIGEIAAASEIPERFLARLMAGNPSGAVGEGFAGTMMEYETSRLQSVVEVFDHMTNYYGPITGWELGAQNTFTSRLIRQTYLAFTHNGPFIVSFDLYRRPSGWMLLRVNVNDRTADVLGPLSGATPAPQ